MKNHQKLFPLIAGGCATLGLALAMMPSSQAEENTIVWSEGIQCIAVGPKSTHLSEQVCDVMKEASASYTEALGQPITTKDSVGNAEVHIERKSLNYFVMHFEQGEMVYYMSDGSIAPLSHEVYSQWSAPQNIDWNTEESRLGKPVHSVFNKGVLATGFERNGFGTTSGAVLDEEEDGTHSDLAFLQYSKDAGRVVDVSSQITGKNIVGWQNSLNFGGGISLPENHMGYSEKAKNYVSASLLDAGYAPYQIGNAHAGFAYDSGTMSIHDIVVSQEIAQPAGTPWVINLSASPADAQDEFREDALKNASEVVRELRKVYPHSHIVLNGIMSAENDTQANSFNTELQKVATNEGADFVDTSGWHDKYKLKSYVIDDGYNLNETGQKKVAYRLKWALRHAIGQ